MPIEDALTTGLAAFAARMAALPVPDEALAAAGDALVDTIGVMLAGRGEPAVARLASALSPGGGTRSVVGPQRLAARDAALLDGMAGHVLDFDDVAQHGHPSVVIVPALLAGAQAADASGADLLCAMVAGYEAWFELAWREPGAYHLGSWHPTPMLGIVAATTALCALERLDERTARAALGLAASFAGGLIASFGTAAKPLQAGRAAAGAIEAVALAHAGIDAGPDAIGGAHGLLQGISPGGRVDTAAPVTVGNGRWRLLDQGLSVKRYPVCHASHRAIDAVLALMAEHRLRLGDVRAITVELGRAPAETLRHHHPATGLEARFSLHHNLAAALVDGAVGFAQLDDAFVTRADVAALYSLTRMVVVDDDPCPDQPGMARCDQVTIETASGAELDSGPVRYPRGHARAPLEPDGIDAKFRDCAAQGGLSKDEAEALLARLRGIRAMPRVAELFG